MSNVEGTVNALRRVLGEGSIFRASDFLEEMPRIPTGVFGLDLAVGGGVPRGKITLLAGKESSCKSAIAYRVIAEVQRQGELAALIDVEQSLTPSWAEIFDIDLDNLLVVYPRTLEEAFNAADAIVHVARPGVLVFDSIAACSPSEEREKSFEEGERRAERAKLNNRFMRIITSSLKPYEDEDGKVRPARTAIIGIQHLYHDPSSRFFVEYMPGGRAQNYLSMLTVYLKRRRWRIEGIVTRDEEGGEDLEDERTVGLDVHWRVEKSKVSPAQREGEFTFFIENTLDGQYYQGQIQEAQHLVDIGRMWGIVRKAGSWYTLVIDGEEHRAQGIHNLTEFFEEHGDAFVREVLTRMKEESEKARELPKRPTLSGRDVGEVTGNEEDGTLDEEEEPTEEGEDRGEE